MIFLRPQSVGFNNYSIKTHDSESQARTSHIARQMSKLFTHNFTQNLVNKLPLKILLWFH